MKKLNGEELLNELNRMKIAIDFMLLFNPTIEGIKIPEVEIKDDIIEIKPYKKEAPGITKTVEQAYQQIKEMIQKPGVTEEWIQKAINYIAEYPSYKRLEEKLKEAGVEVAGK